MFNMSSAYGDEDLHGLLTQLVVRTGGDHRALELARGHDALVQLCIHQIGIGVRQILVHVHQPGSRCDALHRNAVLMTELVL